MSALFSCFSFLLIIYFVLAIVPPPFSETDWTTENVEEGACITPPPKAIVFDTNWLLQLLKDDWYIPLASKMFIYTRATNQKKKVTPQYLENLCLKFKPSTSVAVMVGLKLPPYNDTASNGTTSTSKKPDDTDRHGYTVKRTIRSANNEEPVGARANARLHDPIVLGCHSTKIGEQNCLVKLNGSEPLLAEIESTAVWTDNAKFILLTLCSNKNKMWILLSNQRNITVQERGLIQSEVEKFGFRKSYAYDLIYDNCNITHAHENMITRGAFDSQTKHARERTIFK